MYYFEQDLAKMLADLKSRLDFANIEMDSLPEGRLAKVMREGKETFFNVKYVDGQRVRRSINKKQREICQLAKKEYLTEEIRQLSAAVKVLERFNEKYHDVNADTILGNLPEGLGELAFLELDQWHNSSWESAPYKQSQYKIEKKTHTTSRGLKVRSKSELLIAEKFYEYDIPFRYEQVLEYEGYEVVPDFVINRDVIRMKQGLLTVGISEPELFYWEHCGLTGDSKYMSHHKWKMKLYERNGIVPWKNLIVTYDDENGNLNIPLIESEIIDKVLRL